MQIYLLYFKERLETTERCTGFLEIISEVPDLCSKFLQTSIFKPGFTNERASICNLENKSRNLESASECFNVVLTCLEAFHHTKQCIIFVKIALNILVCGYTHCKESEVIYGDLIEQFADQLGIFFKKIESLQDVVFQQLDELNIAEYLENDLHINCIVLEMGNLCEVVFSLDAEIIFQLWDRYIRIMADHKSLKQISNINSVSAQLVSKNIEILQCIQYNQDKQTEEDEEISANFFFYLDALTSMMNLVHDCFKENISVFKTFLLNLLDCLVSCYSPFTLDKTGLNIIKSALVKNTFALSSHLYPDEEFLKSILPTSDKHTHISNLMLKLYAIQFMENASLQLKKDFFKDIFSDCLSGTAEDDMKFLFISIPLCTVTKTDSDKFVALFQLACEQITEFSKLLPDSVIEELECTILDYLLSSSDLIYLLISDTWMFRLRYGSIEFLKKRCFSTLQYLSVKNVNSIKIESFIKRMLRFLPVSYKDILIEEFPNVNFIRNNECIQHTYGVPYCLSTDEVIIYSQEDVKAMMCKLNECSNNDSLQLIQKACICLELCAHFLSASNSSETLQFIEFASELFKTDVYEIQIAVLTLIKALSKKSLPEHNQEFGNVVEALAQLFSEAMHSKNYIVRYEARCIFSYFAKCTPHVRIIQETLRRDPSLKPIMKSYMNALPDNNFLSEEEKAERLKKQVSRLNDVKFEIPQKCLQVLQQLFSKSSFKLLM